MTLKNQPAPRGLDRFDDAGDILGGKNLANFRQVDKNHVTECILCVRGDADGGKTTVDVEPFVVFGKSGSHGFLLGWGWMELDRQGER